MLSSFSQTQWHTHICMAIEAQKIEILYWGPLFYYEYTPLVHFLSTRWWIHILKSLCKYYIRLQEQTLSLLPQRQNYCFLVGIFLAHEIQGKDLLILNKCIIHLQAMTLYEICSRDGRRLLLQALNGTLRTKIPCYSCPYQPHPLHQCWYIRE